MKTFILRWVLSNISATMLMDKFLNEASALAKKTDNTIDDALVNDILIKNREKIEFVISSLLGKYK